MTLDHAVPARSTGTFLGIDCGTSAVRAAVLAEDGRLLGQGRQTLTGDVRIGHRHEQDPQDWWPAVVAAVRSALAHAPGIGGDVVAVAVAATSGTLLVLDRQGRPVGPALMYDDQRAAAGPSGPTDPAWLAAGNRPQPAWALRRAAWLVARGAVPVGGRLVHQGDHLTAKLTAGPLVTDTAQALKTGVDLLGVSWPRETLRRWGVDADLLPDVVLPGTPVGVLDPAAAAELGVPAGILVRAGTTDGCAGQIAGGALEPGRWTTVLGTTLVVKGVSSAPVVDPAGALYNHRHPDGGWLPGGACSAGAGYLAGKFPGVDPSVAELPAFPVTAVTYPLVGVGERFPFRHPGAHGFSGAQDGTAMALASALQGLALLERLALDTVTALGAEPVGPIRITGGASRDDRLAQLRADVLNRPVQRAQVDEPAVGVAVLAAAAPGTLARTAARMIKSGRRFDPAPGAADRWAGPYQAFRTELQRRGWLAVPTLPASA